MPALQTIYHQLSQDNSYAYKLIGLPPAVLELIESDPNAELVIKADPSHKPRERVVLCTEDTTYVMRQGDHSNKRLLLDDMGVNSRGRTVSSAVPLDLGRTLVGFGTCSYQYELQETVGTIDTSGIARYPGNFVTDGVGVVTDGVDVTDVLNGETSVAELQRTLAICRRDFYREWYAMGGTEVAGNARILDESVITDVLCTIITQLIGNALDYTRESIDSETLLAQFPADLYAREIFTSMMHKFAAGDAFPRFRLDNATASRWIGVQVLRSEPTRGFRDAEFLAAWKLRLPDFYEAPLELGAVRGHYYRPRPDTIRYCDAKQLPAGLAERLRALFRLSPRWRYEEMVPLLADHATAARTVDSIIVKHAKKEDGFVVSGR